MHRAMTPIMSATRRLARAGLALMVAVSLRATAGEAPEKQELTLGFIKLTDCAPLVVAYEKGFFEDEGLYVTLEAQANWKIALDRVIDGALDGAHLLPGQALGAAVGVGTQADLVNVFAMGLNTLAITVSNEVWAEMKPALPMAGDKPVHPIKADALRPVVEAFQAAGEEFRMGMVFPTSTHNYLLRYWLAAGGLHPGFYTGSDATGTSAAQVLLSVTPPPQMPATLGAGTIHGFSVGEPWNQQTVIKGIGVPVITADEIWARTPEKVLGLRHAFVERNPHTTRALVKALLRAAQWLDAAGGANRRELAEMLSRSEYVGADVGVIAGPITGSYQFEKGDVRALPAISVYYADAASYPFYSDAVWYLTQMRRWGQIAQAHPDAWYDEVARRVYRPDVYRAAAEALIATGQMDATALPDTSGYRPPSSAFIDGVEFDARAPNAYLAKFAIGEQAAAGAPAVSTHEP